jgi:hypothetical protein
MRPEYARFNKVLKATNKKLAVFRDMFTDVSEELTTSISMVASTLKIVAASFFETFSCPENVGITSLRNMGKYLPGNTCHIPEDSSFHCSEDTGNFEPVTNLPTNSMLLGLSLES